MTNIIESKARSTKEVTLNVEIRYDSHSFTKLTITSDSENLGSLTNEDNLFENAWQVILVVNGEGDSLKFLHLLKRAVDEVLDKIRET